jgi:transcriptional regulator with XRE-family HTH domain
VPRQSRLVTFGPDRHERADVFLGFGNNLRTLRAAAGLSQDQLAKRCFMPRDQISAIERGVRAADLPAMLVFEERLGVSVTELTAGLTAPIRRAGTVQVLDLLRRQPGLSTDALAAMLGLPFWYVCEIALYLQSIRAIVSEQSGWQPAPTPITRRAEK